MSWTAFVNPVKVITFLTFVYMLVSFDKGRKVHFWLLLIVSLNFLNELTSSMLLYSGGAIKTTTTVYVAVNALLWLALLRTVSPRKKTIGFGMLAVLLFSVTNFLFIDGIRVFNFYTFVVGGLSYVVLFLYDSFAELRSEHLAYFEQPEYLAISSPLLFFVGFSMLLGFRDKALLDYEVSGITLYNIVSYFINIVSYSVLILYIYRVNRMRHAT